MDPDLPDMLNFAKMYNPGYPVGNVRHEAAAAYMHIDPNVRTYVPFLLFIDRKGIIQSSYTGGDEFLKDEAKMDEHIRTELVKRMGLTAVAPRPAAVAPLGSVVKTAPALKK